MNLEIIISSIITIITEVLLWKPMSIVWSTLFKSIYKIGEVVNVELPLTYLIAVKVVEISLIFLTVLIIIVSLRNIFYSDNPII